MLAYGSVGGVSPEVFRIVFRPVFVRQRRLCCLSSAREMGNLIVDRFGEEREEFRVLLVFSCIARCLVASSSQEDVPERMLGCSQTHPAQCCLLCDLWSAFIVSRALFAYHCALLRSSD